MELRSVPLLDLRKERGKLKECDIADIMAWVPADKSWNYSNKIFKYFNRAVRSYTEARMSIIMGIKKELWENFWEILEWIIGRNFKHNRLKPTVGLSLLCSKICLLCFWAFPQFSAYYASFYALQICTMILYLSFFSI